MYKDSKKQGGNILIETIVGLSIVLIAMTGIISLVTRAFSLNSDVSARFVAANLATEGIELTKYYLGANWDAVTPGVYEFTYTCDTFSPLCAINLGTDLSIRSTRPLTVDANGMYSYDAGTPTQYLRSVVIDWSGGSVEVASIVSWKFKGEKNEIQFSNKFFRWHQ